MVVDRALGGSGIGQTITFGSFTFGAQNRNHYIFGRNGYSVTLGTYGDLGGAGAAPTSVYNASSGWLTLNGNVPIGDNAEARYFRVNAGGAQHGDVIFNGSILLHRPGWTV